MPRVVRKQRPPALTDYKKYKSFLRADFERRCAYCHIPESRYGTPGNYAVDHFRPKSRAEFRELICRYSNLYYACRDCNLYKGSTWPARKLQRSGFRFLDPCRIDLSTQWAVDQDGSLKPKTRAAEYMILRLRLNQRFLCDWRRGKSELELRIKEVGSLTASAVRAGEEDLVRGLQSLLQRLNDQILDEYGDFWTSWPG
jgi:hypothetical protein